MTPHSEQALALALAITTIVWVAAASAQEDETSLLAGIVLLSDSEQLQRGRQSFINGEYEPSLVILGQVEPMELGRDQRIQLHEMMGKAHYILGNEASAAVQFFEVLKLEPTYEMDPVSTSRQIIEACEEVRLAHQKDLEKFPVEPERTIPGRNTPQVDPNDMFVAFAPAGVFRLAFLRTPRRGAALLTCQLTPLAVSVATAGYLYWANDKGNFVAVRNAFGVVLTVNIVSGFVSLAVWVVGIVDAFVSQGYHRQSPGSRKRRKVAEGWRWGPPIVMQSYAPD